MKRFMIAGTGSGCGKTTVTCAVLQALINRKKGVASFKTGPDYIDPMFHRTVIGAPAHNLDPFFCGKDALCSLLAKYGDYFNVIEGTMGFYDGGERSAFAVSELTQTPVILVLDCRGMSDSIGALICGFLRYKANHRILGFIFNRLPEKLIPFARQLCKDLGTRFFGAFPTAPFSIESRHLGLVTAKEIVDIKGKMQILAGLAEKFLLLDQLLELPDLPLPAYCFSPPISVTNRQPVIAVARDEAFCFIYEENIDILREIGCKIVLFSPLQDKRLPSADGLYLPGGYPELYAETLSRNLKMRESIRQAIFAGMPCIAECGGFLYLQESLKTAQGRDFQMVGIFPGHAYPTKSLQRFGYVTLHSRFEHLLAAPENPLTAHEFHYWESDLPGDSLHAIKPNGKEWDCCYAKSRIYAGFPHLYWYADSRPAQRFAAACAAFQEESDGTSQTNL